ncbi:MAG TPA: hypothetical protein VNR66_08865 [Solirubrobacteraceae bacterium]|jgi:hypothetical protein|nr:hypothetical protein [Solirubrobacteraceae bacterium]
MSLADLDRTRRALAEAVERIRQNLVELELDPGRELLQGAPLEGRTAAAWSAANAELSELWRQHGQLEALLERAGELRSARRIRPEQLDTLRDLLEGPSIGLSSRAVPMADRALLGTAEVTQRCSPAELLDRMSAAFDRVKTVVGQIGSAWETVVPRLDGARRLQLDTRRLAEALGEPGRADLEQAGERVATLGAAVTADPLSIDSTDLDVLVRELQMIHNELESTAELSRDFEHRFTVAQELVGQVRTAVAESEAAREELMVKIASPNAPAPASSGLGPGRGPGDELDSGLAEIVALAEARAWRDARIALERWTARATAMLEAARRSAEANRAPIEARNQLRALLEAYQAKAKHLGLIEDPELAELFTCAREELYHAPTDLDRGGQLVRRYQEALSGSGTAEETPR